MRRRRVLAALGAAATLAGCSGATDGSGTATAGDETATRTGTERTTPAAATDGYPSADAIAEVPPPPEADPASFEIVTYEGAAVPLVPIDVAYDWYRRREARFADARPVYAYERAHVLGAVPSPAPDGPDGNDPVTAWPSDGRIVTYCGCPHHLSSMRAATLLDAGHERVYALDEGFGAWVDRRYPMAGEQVQNRRSLADRPPERVVRGSVPERAAAGYAWARHEPTGQAEAAPIESDGRYEISLRFWNLASDATLTVETPAYTVSAPLRELTSRHVTAATGRA
jgi:rhodanese-related sulfurtransferase